MTRQEPASPAGGSGAPSSQTAPPAANPAPAEPAPVVVRPPTPGDSLKDFLKENSTLIFLIGSMTSLTTFVVNLQLGWLDSYLKAVLLSAALLLWMELHAQWPREVRLPDRIVHPRTKTTRPWRLVLFAALMQVTIVLFAVWAIVRAPEVVAPLVAAVAGWLLARRLPLRGRTGLAAMAAIAVVAFLASELALERIFPHKQTLLDALVRDAEQVGDGVVSRGD